MSKLEIRTINLRIQNLKNFIAIETNPVAKFNMEKDLAFWQAKVLEA